MRFSFEPPTANFSSAVSASSPATTHPALHFGELLCLNPLRRSDPPRPAVKAAPLDARARARARASGTSGAAHSLARARAARPHRCLDSEELVDALAECVPHADCRKDQGNLAKATRLLLTNQFALGEEQPMGLTNIMCKHSSLEPHHLQLTPGEHWYEQPYNLNPKLEEPCEHKWRLERQKQGHADNDEATPCYTQYRRFDPHSEIRVGLYNFLPEKACLYDYDAKKTLTVYSDYQGQVVFHNQEAGAALIVRRAQVVESVRMRPLGWRPRPGARRNWRYEQMPWLLIRVSDDGQIYNLRQRSLTVSIKTVTASGEFLLDGAGDVNVRGEPFPSIKAVYHYLENQLDSGGWVDLKTYNKLIHQKREARLNRLERRFFVMLRELVERTRAEDPIKRCAHLACQAVVGRALAGLMDTPAPLEPPAKMQRCA